MAIPYPEFFYYLYFRQRYDQGFFQRRTTINGPQKI